MTHLLHTPATTATQATSAETRNSPALLWKLPEVQKHYPASKASIYAWVKAGRFPAPIKIGPRAVAWRSADILALTK